VIDVLRASTTLVTALNNGAQEIVPVGSIEFAMKVSGSTFSGKTLLAGERNSKKIDGFALGNSPYEYERDLIEGKTIILFTTNGSKAIVRAKYSANLMIASFVNTKSVAKSASDLSDLVILCSGNNGLFSYEDSVSAGGLISEIVNMDIDVELDDASKTCLFLFEKHSSDLRKMLQETEHGKFLIQEGFENDLMYAAKKDLISAVPIFQNGAIKIKK
jgi:2-phosphosulfolactate phosphatase